MTCFVNRPECSGPSGLLFGNLPCAWCFMATPQDLLVLYNQEVADPSVIDEPEEEEVIS